MQHKLSNPHDNTRGSCNFDRLNQRKSSQYRHAPTYIGISAASRLSYAPPFRFFFAIGSEASSFRFVAVSPGAFELLLLESMISQDM